MAASERWRFETGFGIDRKVKLKRILSQVSASAVSKVLSLGINAAYFLVIAIWLPKSDLGVYAFCLAAGQLASEVTTFGTNPVIVRRIASESSTLGITSGTALFQRLTFPLALAFIVSPVLILAPVQIDHPGLLLLAFAACAVGQIAGFIKQLFVAQQKFWHYTWTEQAGLIFRVAAGLLLVLMGHGAAGLIVGLLMGYLLDALMAGFIASKTLGFSLLPRIDLPELKALLKEGFPLVGLVLFNQALARADWIMMGAMRSAEETGEYAFAYRIFELSWLPHAILGTVLLPKLSSALRSGDVAYESRHRLTLLHRLMVSLSVVLPLAILLAWSPVIDSLTEDKYGKVNELVMMILCVSVPFAAGTGLMWNTAIALKKTAGIMVISCASSLLSVAMNFLLIPSLGGTGAAMASSIPFTIQYFLYSWLLRRSFFLLPIISGILVCMIAGTIAFISANMLITHWFLKVTTGSLTYLAFSVLILHTAARDLKTLARGSESRGRGDEAIMAESSG
ncbi:MAG: oligosaccharide flippase family protein [Deltaproteobacteria bacterium]|nr:oligosaccharide flippase family protein [Deltaproteobacteria bacterium]